MKDVIERLEQELDSGFAVTMDSGSRYRIFSEADLKALLSYTKQCEEALRPFSDAANKLGDAWNPWEVRWNEAEGIVDVGHLRAARQALSLIQQGE